MILLMTDRIEDAIFRCLTAHPTAACGSSMVESNAKVVVHQYEWYGGSFQFRAITYLDEAMS